MDNSISTLTAFKRTVLFANKLTNCCSDVSYHSISTQQTIIIAWIMDGIPASIHYLDSTLRTETNLLKTFKWTYDVYKNWIKQCTRDFKLLIQIGDWKKRNILPLSTWLKIIIKRLSPCLPSHWSRKGKCSNVTFLCYRISQFQNVFRQKKSKGGLLFVCSDLSLNVFRTQFLHIIWL